MLTLHGWVCVCWVRCVVLIWTLGTNVSVLCVYLRNFVSGFVKIRKLAHSFENVIIISGFLIHVSYFTFIFPILFNSKEEWKVTLFQGHGTQFSPLSPSVWGLQNEFHPFRNYIGRRKLKARNRKWDLSTPRKLCIKLKDGRQCREANNVLPLH
jgi:hypothetical protein